MDKKKLIKLIGIVVAATLIGLSQLGVFPDLGLASAILTAVGATPAVAVQPVAGSGAVQ
jgi:hypothetical protein